MQSHSHYQMDFRNKHILFFYQGAAGEKIPFETRKKSLCGAMPLKLEYMQKILTITVQGPDH